MDLLSKNSRNGALLRIWHMVIRMLDTEQNNIIRNETDLCQLVFDQSNI
jgi:hypothetical protein